MSIQMEKVRSGSGSLLAHDDFMSMCVCVCVCVCVYVGGGRVCLCLYVLLVYVHVCMPASLLILAPLL